MNRAQRRAYPQPKPPRRIVSRDAGRVKVTLEGRCRACGRVPTGHPLDSLNRAHIVPKGQRGDDVDDNIIPLCGSGTTGCHGSITTHDKHWRVVAAAIRQNLLGVELAYIARKIGPGWGHWLDRVYPAAGS